MDLIQIRGILNKLESNKNETIITGEFNIDLLKINDKYF